MRVYQFGVRGIPERLPQEAFDQLRMQNDFRNDLVALHREHDALYYQTLRESDEEIVSLEERYDQLDQERERIRNQMSKRRQDERGPAEDQDLRDDFDRVDRDRNQVKAELKKARDRARRIPEVAERLAKQNAELKLQIKSLRQQYNQAGLYWGNANAIKDSFEKDRRAVLKKRGKGEQADLHYHPFRGEGRLTVQLQKGLPVASLFSGQSYQLQIDPVSDDAFDHPERSVRRRERKTTGRLRVKSNGRLPVWLEFRVTVHRRIPSDAVIKMAQLVRRRVGSKWRWSLSVTVQEPERDRAELPNNEMGIDLGWCNMGDRLRVGYYGCGCGSEGEIGLDGSFLRASERCQGLQATMDDHFNAIREAFVSWREQGLLPEWILERIRLIQNWKSPAKLVRVVRDWSDYRFDGDEEMFGQAWAWRAKHLHLYEWKRNLEDKIAARRREQYRLFAKWASENFWRIYVEDLKISQLNRRNNPESGVDRGQQARRQAALASPGELMRELRRACVKTGSEVVEVSARYTSRTCPNCKARLPRQGGAREFYCAKCGLLWDRDQGAAMNLLERGSRMRCN